MRVGQLVKIGIAVAAGAAAALIGRGQPAVRLQVGDAAPDFSLHGSDGRLHTLAEHKGRRAVVLAWFPKAFTGGCTVECRSLRESSETLRAFDVAYFAASTDDLETNTAFARQLEADYPILADPTKATARAYGVLGLIGMPSRWTFYIGVDGRIQRIDQDVHTSTAGADMAAALAELGVARRPL